MSISTAYSFTAGSARDRDVEPRNWSECCALDDAAREVLLKHRRMRMRALLDVMPAVMSRFWSVHSHSRQSSNDAMPSVKDLVAGAVELGYPALGLTDHGSMGGVVELYTEGKKAGLPVAPGTELYVTTDAAPGRPQEHAPDGRRDDRPRLPQPGGAEQLGPPVEFHHRPRVDFPQLARLAEDGLLEGLAVGTGCRSGPVVRALTERGPAAAEQVVNALAGWFPRLYVELMDHGFAADGMWDWQITNELVGIAARIGIPTIITSDSHYVRREDQVLHDAFKTLVTWSEDPEDGSSAARATGSSTRPTSRRSTARACCPVRWTTWLTWPAGCR